MIRSMTGYGKGQAAGRFGLIIVEMRSLNHKYFDLAGRLPNHLSILDDKLREYIKQKIKRGRISLSVSWEGKDKPKAVFKVDLKLAQKYNRELSRLQKELKLKNDLTISQIAFLPDVIVYEQQKEDVAQFWLHLKPALDMALDQLLRMREAEGKRLAQDLSARIKKINSYVLVIEKQLPRVIAGYKRAFLQKVKALSGIKQPNRDRIAEEVALFVRSSDVSEELTRIKSHVQAFNSAMASQPEAGKELDFIAQELFREVNTIGAKANKFKIAQQVIKIKSQIEKVREQLQNVE